MSPSSHSPRVSAIVSLYNAERFVRGCLDDLIAQSLFHQGELEIVVIDSASPQGEWAIVSEYVARFPLAIKAVRTSEREGLYAAWNRAVELSCGRYITNANADDRHREDALEILASALDENPETDLAYADCLVTFRENETVQNHTRSGVLLRPEWSAEILSEGCHMGPQPMWRRTVHERIGLFDTSYRSAGDYEFWCRMAAAGMTMIHVPDFLGLYLENPVGICNADPTLGELETNRVRQSYAGRIPSTQRSWIDNRVHPVQKPDEYAHLMIRLVGCLQRVEAYLNAVIAFTAFPHRVTVLTAPSTADVQGYLSEMLRCGLIHRIATAAAFVPEEQLQAGKEWEPQARWQVLLSGECAPQRRDWLARLLCPAGIARRGKLCLTIERETDLSMFPGLMKLTNHPCARPILWIASRLLGFTRTLKALPSHGLEPLSIAYSHKPLSSAPYIPLAVADLEGPFVHVVMLSYNRLDFTRSCVEGLHRTASFPYRLTIIDNNSSDGSREWLEEALAQGWISRLCALQENVGVARAANLGWSLEPCSSWFLKLDNDMVMQRTGWLESMIDIFEGWPEIGAIAANVEPVSYPLEEMGQLALRTKRGTLGGACVMISRQVHDQLGFWSEAYGKYGEEDFDYGFRALLTGRRNAYLADEDIAFHLPAGKAALIDDSSFLARDGKEEELHREYRLEKDRQRLQNHQSGTVNRRLSAYLDGSTPLRQESPFAREHNGAAILSQPPPKPWKRNVATRLVDIQEDRMPLPRTTWKERMLLRLGFGTI